MTVQGPIGSADPIYSFGEQLLGGVWRQGSSGNRTVVRSPWDGEAVAEIVEADVSDVDAAYEGARIAQPGWAAALPSEQAAVFRRVAEVTEARREEIVN